MLPSPAPSLSSPVSASLPPSLPSPSSDSSDSTDATGSTVLS